MENTQNKSAEILQKLYATEDALKTSDGKPLKANKEGSLGLLALGYRGLIAWRIAKKDKKTT